MKSTFESMMQIAEVLAENELLPEHLRGRKAKNGKWEPFSPVQRRAICFSVVNAANLWRCNPFMLAEQSFSVHGRLDYSGAFYAALANTRGNLDRQLSHKFSGQGPDRRIVVSGRIRGESQQRTATMTLFEGKRSGNAPSWETDPDQMLVYACSRRWVRRHCPQVLLGLVPEDDTEPDQSAQPLIDEGYAARIDQACDTESLKLIAAEISADEALTVEEKDTYLQMGRTAYSALSMASSSDRTVQYTDPTESFQRWERTIKGESSPDRLIEHLDAILADKGLTEREAKSLHELVNLQMKVDDVPAG